MHHWQITYTTASEDEFVIAARLRIDSEDYMLFGDSDENHGSDVRWAAPRGRVQSVTRLAPANTED